MEVVRRDSLPFIVSTNGKIQEGLHSNVFALGEDWVVKEINPFFKRGKWQEKLYQDFKLLTRYLGIFIPDTSLIQCSEDEKTNNLLIVQKRIEGNPLRNFSWGELKDNDVIIRNLLTLGASVEQMYKETRMTPDLHGGTKNILRQYDFHYSNNIMIDKHDQVWWIDIDRLGPFWSPNWIGGRVHMAMMMRSFKLFLQKLQN